MYTGSLPDPTLRLSSIVHYNNSWDYNLYPTNDCLDPKAYKNLSPIKDQPTMGCQRHHMICLIWLSWGNIFFNKQAASKHSLLIWLN